MNNRQDREGRRPIAAKRARLGATYNRQAMWPESDHATRKATDQFERDDAELDGVRSPVHDGWIMDNTEIR